MMMQATVSDVLLEKIALADCPEPFSVLGMHELMQQGTAGVVVRAFQPGAQGLCVVPEERQAARQAMTRVHPAGFYEAVIPDRRDFFAYRLERTEPGGQKRVFYDPYSFPPVLSDYDLHLFSEGNHHKIYEKLGAHTISLNGIEGTLFAVWAPSAQRVSVVGDFNRWDGRTHVMRTRGSSGVWELFVPELAAGTLYKYEIKASSGILLAKSDPYAQQAELRPKTASIVPSGERYQWHDSDWMQRRYAEDQLAKPISIYEVHLGSWHRMAGEGNRSLTYREAASSLVDYVAEMGYTHIEFLPLASHPFDPSWGYQLTGYYSPTARYGPPEDLMYLIDQCHRQNIGVLFDWVPAHFPTDGHGLANFDGTCLYEHADPRQGRHPDWGTLVFNYGRKEVQNFLLANALYWLDKYHVDGLRVDAVASMLYLDYSRGDGEWIPNHFGGRENLEAISFLKKLNEVVHQSFPGILMIAEESTAWPAVSRPTYLGGLGFSLKWNMGWMHDVLVYMSKEPIYRKYHHTLLTFALLYTFHENFVLPFSHDEVVHGKGSLLGKMPGDPWQKFAGLRLLLGYMFGHPGKKHLFMGIDIGQWSEWDHNGSVEWDLLKHAPHQKLQHFVRDLNHLYRSEPALFEQDFDQSGFEWIDFNDTESSVVAFVRNGRDGKEFLVVVYNCTPVPRHDYNVGVPREGWYHEVLNSDAECYGGSNMGNRGGVQSRAVPHHGRPHHISIVLPPLSCLMFKIGG